jgi:hypothetical protein
MAEIRSHGIGVPILFPIDAQGIAVVSERHLCIRFSLQADTVWVEREIFDPDTGLLVHTFHESSKLTDNGNVWELGAGQYRVVGWPDSEMRVSTELLAPLRSSTADFSTPPVISVKTEPDIENVVDLSDSSTEDVSVKKAAVHDSPSLFPSDSFVTPSPSRSVPLSPSVPSTSKPPPVHKAAVHDSPSLFPSDSFVTPSPSRYAPLSPSVPSTSKPPPPIVQCLRRLGSIPGSKSVLKKIDYDKIKIQEVNHLPPRFDGTQLFVLPAPEVSSSQSRAKSMDGMDKQYDGHVWTRTQTTNITNDVGLVFRSSTCVGHLQCQNPTCDYLQRAHRISQVNDTEFDGFTTQPFPLSGIVPSGSTLVCRICKQPPKCIALCEAKIFYVHGKNFSQRACIHIGTHQHPVKVGDCRHSRKRINALLEEHVERTPQATHSKIVLEASKDIVGEFLLSEDSDKHRLLSLKELEPVFESCRELNSPNLRSKVTSFKFLRRFGVMDGIAKLRGVSNWAYVQRNQFPGQGDDADKVFVFKMSEVGPGSGVDLVRRMQPGGDLENAWIMSDHVKRVKGWTTMAAHVYDGTYQRVMTISCCDFQSEDKDAQVLFWQNLNHVMARHGIPHPTFIGFMADSAQANWNAVRIVYGSGDPKIPMEGRERTCFFHWKQSLEKHTKSYIKHELQDQHRHLCLQYRNASSMAEAETRYLAIKAWWASSNCTSEDGLKHLQLWLAFWHFRYLQWGGFMELVHPLHASLFFFPGFSFLSLCSL